MPIAVSSPSLKPGCTTWRTRRASSIVHTPDRIEAVSPGGVKCIAAFGTESRRSWTATAGTTYYISVAGYNGNQGSFGFVVESPSATLVLSFFNFGPGTLGWELVHVEIVGHTIVSIAS